LQLQRDFHWPNYQSGKTHMLLGCPTLTFLKINSSGSIELVFSCAFNPTERIINKNKILIFTRLKHLSYSLIILSHLIGHKISPYEFRLSGIYVYFLLRLSRKCFLIV